jgi:Txe/YoeB family toxin of toxin-antitoxin system
VIRGRRPLVIQPEALEDLPHWVDTDRKTALRVVRLIEAVQRSPFEGLGKPEPLRHIGSDVWSRAASRNRIGSCTASPTTPFTSFRRDTITEAASA